MPHKVVFTDYYYPTLDEERKVFVGTNIKIVDGTTPNDSVDGWPCDYAPLRDFSLTDEVLGKKCFR